MKVERFNNEQGYGVYVVLEGQHYGEAHAHTSATKQNPEAVRIFCDEMEERLIESLEMMKIDQ